MLMLKTLYGGQIRSSTQVIILNYPVIISHQCSTIVSLETYPLLFSYLWLSRWGYSRIGLISFAKVATVQVTITDTSPSKDFSQLDDQTKAFGQYSADCWPTSGQLSAYFWPTSFSQGSSKGEDYIRHKKLWVIGLNYKVKIMITCW